MCNSVEYAVLHSGPLFNYNETLMCCNQISICAELQNKQTQFVFYYNSRQYENYLAANTIYRKQVFQEKVGFSIWVYLDNFGLHL